VGTAERRILENNRLFREANDKIRAASEEYDDPVEPIPFLCECPEESCSTIVRLTANEYCSIRAKDRQFFTAAGHEQAEKPVGSVIARHDGYVVIEKSG
jgi:hypothetical protein